MYRATEEAFRSLGVKTRAITESDALAADDWADKHGVRTWNWLQFLHAARKDPKRFDIAISVDETLCALCIGVPTGGKVALKLLVVQANPGEHPLRGKVLSVIFSAAHAYARALGSLSVYICEPANEHLIALYERFGYQPVRGKTGVVTHMEKAT